MVVLISLLTFFDVRLSSTLLAIGLLSEIAILIIFDIFMFSKGQRPLGRAQPGQRVQDLPGHQGAGRRIGRADRAVLRVLVLGRVSRWHPTDAEESRQPKRIVPRALYISVIALGVFYTLTSWAPLFGYPSTHAAIVAGAGQRGELLPGPGRPVRGPLGVLDHELPDHHRLVRLRDGVPQHRLPVHVTPSAGRGCCPPRWAAPTPGSRARTSRRWSRRWWPRSSSSCSRCSPGTNDPNSQAYLQLYGLMAVMGVIIILSVQALVSLAILVYYERHHRDEAALVGRPGWPGPGAGVPGRRGLPAVRQTSTSWAAATRTRSGSARSTWRSC